MISLDLRQSLKSAKTLACRCCSPTNIYGTVISTTLLRISSMLLGFATNIVAARVLGPEKLGVSGVIYSLVGQLIVLTNLNLDPALVREYKSKKAEDRKILVADLFVFRATASLFICIALGGIGMATTSVRDWWLPGGLGLAFYIANANSPLWVLQSTDRLPLSYLVNVFGSLITLILIVYFTSFTSRAGIDICSQAVGTGFVCIALWWIILRENQYITSLSRGITAMVDLIGRNRSLVICGFVVYAYAGIDAALIALLRGNADAGIYRCAAGLLAPLTSIMGLVPIIMYPKLLEWRENGDRQMWKELSRVVTIMAPLVIIVALVSFLLAPRVFDVLYGHEYRRSAAVFSILFLAKGVALVNGVYVWAIYAIRKDLAFLIIAMCVTIQSLFLNYLVVPIFGPEGSATVNLASEISILVSAGIYCHKRLNKA